jgi:hypothetical protein
MERVTRSGQRTISSESAMNRTPERRRNKFSHARVLVGSKFPQLLMRYWEVW